MQVHTSPCKPRPHALGYTDWDAFRVRRQHSAAPDIDDLSQWTDQLLADLDGVTASIPTTANHPAIDSRLAHLQAAHTSLTNRWNKQRHNRRIRRRIAYLDREIETHTTALARQQWEQLCSGLSSQLGSKQSWHLLRHLLDPTSAKSVTRQQLQRVIRAYPGDTSALMADLAAKYLQLLPSDALTSPLEAMAKRNATRKQGGAAASQPTHNVQRQTIRPSPPGKTSTRPPGSRQRSPAVLSKKSTSPPGAAAAMCKADDTVPAPGRPSDSQVEKPAAVGATAERGRAAARAPTRRAGKGSRGPSHSEDAVATAEPLVEAVEKKNPPQPKRKQLGRSCVTANHGKNVVGQDAKAENTPSRPEEPASAPAEPTSAPAAVDSSECHQEGQGPPASSAMVSVSGDGRKSGAAAKAPKRAGRPAKQSNAAAAPTSCAAKTAGAADGKSGSGAAKVPAKPETAAPKCRGKENKLPAKGQTAASSSGAAKRVLRRDTFGRCQFFPWDQSQFPSESDSD
ncbi:hypothetical protein MTO96_026814 [Rhipicephalus appendiculatus]